MMVVPPVILSTLFAYNWYPCVNSLYLRVRKNSVYNRTALSFCVIKKDCPHLHI